MTKGKYGLNPVAMAIIAFVIGFFGFLESLILIVAFAVMAEKDDWLTKQTLQALLLRFSYNIISIVLGWIFNGFQAVLNTFDAYEAMKTVGNIQNFMNGVLYVVLFVFVLLAVVNLLKGREVKIPFVTEVANYTVGIMTPRFTDRPAPMNTNFVQSTQVERNNHQFVKDQMVNKSSQGSKSSSGNAENWVCKCGRENKGNFCMACGSPRNQ